jgi:hypothetical protein
MSKIPAPMNELSSKIFAAIKANTKELPRAHLGASLIGHSCDRWLWLSFRWAVQEDFDGRILRLFRRGQNEEASVVADMRLAGLEIEAEENGKQFRVELAPHFSGSMDGIVLSGVPEAPNKKHILEIKTHSKKSFDDLEKKGVQKAKPMHYAQMQTYMLGTGIDRALYVSVCKDDDRIYTERVRFNKEEAEALKARAIFVIQSDRMPEPLSADPSWFECKFCAAWDFCHKTKLTQKVNCRTCAHSTAKDGGWHCARWDSIIPLTNQHIGCDSHVLHPDLVPFTLVGGDEINAEYEYKGVRLINGEGGTSSIEILRSEAEM